MTRRTVQEEQARLRKKRQKAQGFFSIFKKPMHESLTSVLPIILIVLVLGISLAVYYLSFGIFYNEDTFLVSTLGKKSDSYRYSQIVSQKLYLITGGNIVVELTMDTGSTVSLQSTMDGVYPFLDAAFSAWCRQKGIREADCPFHDPSKSWWFPHEEE